MQVACYAVPNWRTHRLPKIRLMTKFLRMTEYRKTWAESLRSAGKHAEANELDKAYEGSFLHWRWETIAVAYKELQRLMFIFTYAFNYIWGATQEPELVADFCKYAHDTELLAHITAMKPPLAIMESTRKWGTWCSCGPLDSKELSIPRASATSG